MKPSSEVDVSARRLRPPQMLFGVRASQSHVITASPDRKKIRDGQLPPNPHPAHRRVVIVFQSASRAQLYSLSSVTARGRDPVNGHCFAAASSHALERTGNKERGGIIAAVIHCVGRDIIGRDVSPSTNGNAEESST